MTRLLADIDDVSLGLAAAAEPRDARFVERRAARAVVFNNKNEVALLHVAGGDYYKLPGGGMEDDEDWQAAVIREALEETGCHIRLRPVMLGEIVEWRQRPQDWFDGQKLKQVSFCGIGDVTGRGEQALTPDEIAAGLSPVWLPPQRALELLGACASGDYEGTFITARDRIFLQAALV